MVMWEVPWGWRWDGGGQWGGQGRELAQTFWDWRGTEGPKLRETEGLTVRGSDWANEALGFTWRTAGMVQRLMLWPKPQPPHPHLEALGPLQQEPGSCPQLSNCSRTTQTSQIQGLDGAGWPEGVSDRAPRPRSSAFTKKRTTLLGPQACWLDSNNQLLIF